jgi:hypothetical protein
MLPNPTTLSTYTGSGCASGLCLLLVQLPELVSAAVPVAELQKHLQPEDLSKIHLLPKKISWSTPVATSCHNYIACEACLSGPVLIIPCAFAPA